MLQFDNLYRKRIFLSDSVNFAESFGATSSTIQFLVVYGSIMYVNP